jgi:hypothetical protein
VDSYPVEKRAAYVWRATCIAGGKYEMHKIKTPKGAKNCSEQDSLLY